MTRRRGPRPVVDLCNGPAKLCVAFDITREQNGASLLGPDIFIEEDGTKPPEITTTARVGLSAGKELPLRFLVTGNPFVSRGKPSAQI